MYMLYVEKLRVKVSVIIVMRSFSISNLRKIQQHEFPVILMSHFPFGCMRSMSFKAKVGF